MSHQPRMQKCERVILEVWREIAEPLGVTVKFITGRRHTALEVTAPDGRRHKQPLASSPRTDGTNVARQDARRVLRQWGLI